MIDGINISFTYISYLHNYLQRSSQSVIEYKNLNRYLEKKKLLNSELIFNFVHYLHFFCICHQIWNP